MPTRYRYKARCSECPQEFKSNWSVGTTSVEQRLLWHKIKIHGYKPSDKEKEKLGIT